MTDFLPENDQELRDCLSELAESIVAQITHPAPEHYQELLSAFVSQLFLCATRQSIRKERKARQAEGIAKAKAKGVSFGRKLRPLPDNFEEARLLWRSHEMNLQDAAKHCGLPKSTFYGAVQRVESANKL